MRYDVEREKIYVRTEADGCCLYTLWFFFSSLSSRKSWRLKTEKKASLFYFMKSKQQQQKLKERNVSSAEGEREEIMKDWIPIKLRWF